MRSREATSIVTPAPSSVPVASPPTGVTLSFNSPQGSRRARQEESPGPVIVKPWPKDLLSLGGITVGSLFSRWYTDELYNCEHKSAKERQGYNMCGKLVEYCKLFLPGGSVIIKKPADASALIAWRQQLTRWGQMLDEKVHAFATNGKVLGKRNRSCQPFVAASYKRLTVIDGKVDGVRTGVQPQQPVVVDYASPLVVYTMF